MAVKKTNSQIKSFLPFSTQLWNALPAGTRDRCYCQSTCRGLWNSRRTSISFVMGRSSGPVNFLNVLKFNIGGPVDFLGDLWIINLTSPYSMYCEWLNVKTTPADAPSLRTRTGWAVKGRSTAILAPTHQHYFADNRVSAINTIKASLNIKTYTSQPPFPISLGYPAFPFPITKSFWKYEVWEANLAHEVQRT